VKHSFFLFLIFFPWLNTCPLRAQQSEGTVSVGHLRCEHRENPIGVDRSAPLLSWSLESPQRSQKQNAYEILVASDQALLATDKGDLWDSGKVISDHTVQIPYAGKALEPAQHVYWKVRSWDGSGKPTAWSEPAAWTMGLPDKKDWGDAQWITGPIRDSWDFPTPPKKTSLAPGSSKSSSTILTPSATPSPIPSPTPWLDPKLTDSILLRHEFNAPKKIRRASLFICGLGQYEMFLNGNPVTDTFLNPGWTDYSKTCLYDSYDVTGLVKEGSNAIGALLGNSFFNMHPVPPGRYKKNEFKTHFEAPRLIALLHFEYQDGSSENVASGSSWVATPGPLTLSHIYAGEDYDARLLPEGWAQAGFNASSWSPAEVVKGPGGILKGISASAPPIRFFETFKPVATKENRPGVTTYDFGQNAAVVLRMKVKGPAGSVIRVEPSELVDANGKISTGNIRSGHAYWTYTLKGVGEETYQGTFFYQGARYFEVERIPAKDYPTLPEILSVEARVVQADAPSAGSFQCSNDLFNRVWKLIRWAQRSNMVSIMTDCPTREKLGWLEQIHLNGPALHDNWNMSLGLGKMMNDMSDAQQTNGFVPTTAPTYASFHGDFLDSPEWGSSAVIVPWQMYQTYGDTNVIADHYEMMKGFADYLLTKSKTNIVCYGLGDWYDIGPKHPFRAQLTQLEITGTGYLYEDTRIVAEAAALLGKSNDSIAYSERAEAIKSTFNERLFNKEKGSYGTSTNYPVGSQCANALPLVFGLVETNRISSVTKALISDIKDKGNTGGDVGYRYVLRALADAGASDVIYAMNNQSEKPGYGMQLKKGATSLTEPWSGDGNSQNHFMLGQLNEWLYNDLVGIQLDPKAPGFKHFVISPAIVGDLTWAEASYDSVHGTIQCRWERSGNSLSLKVTIPPNTSAIIRIPNSSPDLVQESGMPLSKVEGIKVLRAESGALFLEAGSGRYEFTAPYSKP